jgi:hypothetical protein
MASQTDTVHHELSLKNEGVYPATVSRNPISWLKGLFAETPFGIRRHTEKMVAHRECFEATTAAVEALHHLYETEDRLCKEDVRAQLDHEIAVRDRVFKLKQMKREFALIDVEYEVKKARLLDEKEKIEQGDRPRSQQKHESPTERKLREMRTRAEEAIEIGRLAAGIHKQQLTELDDAVKSGKLGAAAAEHIKQQLKAIYECGSVQP